MPKITVDHKSSVSAPDAIVKIKQFFETDATLKQIDGDLKCDFSDATLSGKVSGSKFKADVKIKSEGSGSMINVVIDLPLLLSPFKSKVEEVLKHKLDKYLA